MRLSRFEVRKGIKRGKLLRQLSSAISITSQSCLRRPSVLHRTFLSHPSDLIYGRPRHPEHTSVPRHPEYAAAVGTLTPPLTDWRACRGERAPLASGHSPPRHLRACRGGRTEAGRGICAHGSCVEIPEIPWTHLSSTHTHAHTHAHTNTHRHAEAPVSGYPGRASPVAPVRPPSRVTR
jgi:hypothetical protein